MARQHQMKTVAPLIGDGDGDGDGDGEQETPIRPLTAEEVRRLREQHPLISPWWVVAGQVVVGFLAAVVAWVITGKQSIGWSIGYGAIAVAIPAALFARGITSRFSSANAATAAAGFLVWEMVKIASTIVLLGVGPKLVADLNWVAMLIGLVLAMKVYWLALAFKPRPRRTET